ncbi:MAG: D-glycero-beta-D-manno-heptose 1-phosphate adenylyltransferase [Fibrobacterota bacterium]
MAVSDLPVFENAEAVKNFLAPLRQLGKKVVTTNGCFDIIHAGHIQYLSEAASLGDLLVVGINSDSSVRMLKGPSRPLQSEIDRATVMAALKMVSASFIFNQADPRTFLDIIKPEIHVKGGDYTADIIEAPTVQSYGGKVAIVSFREGYSTSRIVEKIKNHLNT